FVQRLHRAGDVGVVSMKFVAFDHDRVDRANAASRRVDEIEIWNDGEFVRNRHAQSAQAPVEFSGLRMNEAAHERSQVIDLERQIAPVAVQNLERRVMQQRRARMAYWIADDAENLARAREFFDPVKVAQFGDGRLPGGALGPATERAE